MAAIPAEIGRPQQPAANVPAPGPIPDRAAKRCWAAPYRALYSVKYGRRRPLRSRRITAGWRSLRGCALCLLAILVVAMSVVTGPFGETVEGAGTVADAAGGSVAPGRAWTPPLQVNCAEVGGGHFSGAHCVVILAGAPSSTPSHGETAFPQAPQVPRVAGAGPAPAPAPTGLVSRLKRPHTGFEQVRGRLSRLPRPAQTGFGGAADPRARRRAVPADTKDIDR